MKSIKLSLMVTAIVSLFAAIINGLLAYNRYVSNEPIINSVTSCISAVVCIACAVAFFVFSTMNEQKLLANFNKLSVWSIVGLFASFIIGIVSFGAINQIKKYVMSNKLNRAFRKYMHMPVDDDYDVAGKEPPASPEELSLENIEYLKNTGKLSEDDYNILKKDIYK